MQRAKLPSLSLAFLLLTLVMAPRANAQGTTVRVVVYRSPESLTLYLPNPGLIDITGLYIEATTAIGETVRRDLAMLPAFRGLPYNRLPAPICFHLISTNSTTLPLDCQTITTLTQVMAVGDVFWYEQGDRTLIFYFGDIPQICPAGAPRCTLVFPALPTPTPTATHTPTNIATATATATATFTPTTTPIYTYTPIPSGYPGNSVTSNDQWTPTTQDFDGVTMVLVPVGCFMMGSNDGGTDEQPIHQVCFELPFWIDQTEVTNGQYGSAGNFGFDQRPRETVTWFEARDFCASRTTRLPTEAEWEYAARGPDGLLYPWGNEWHPDYVVWQRDNEQGPAEVGSIPFGHSWVGALDMIGNVWEWTSSLYLPYDSNESREFDTGNRTDVSRVLRGGSWYNRNIVNLRATYRNSYVPNTWGSYIGFRCARSF